MDLYTRGILEEYNGIPPGCNAQWKVQKIILNRIQFLVPVCDQVSIVIADIFGSLFSLVIITKSILGKVIHGGQMISMVSVYQTVNCLSIPVIPVKGKD